MNYYYLVNGQRIEIEHVCYSTTTGDYYGRPSETWVVGNQPGHTRRSVLLRPTDCDAYIRITELELYCRIEAAHRTLVQYREIANTALEPLLRDLRRHVHLLYLLAEGDPDINWVDTTSTRDIHSSNVYQLNPLTNSNPAIPPEPIPPEPEPSAAGLADTHPTHNLPGGGMNAAAISRDQFFRPRECFISLPNVVFDDLMPTMTGNEMKVYMILWRKSWGYNSETCTLSYDQLATAAGVSVSTTIRSIDELEGRGLVTVTRTRRWDIHSSNVYRLNPPPNITPTEGGGNDDN